MYSNDKLVLQLLSLLRQFGINQIVVSPGSRHFSLVHSLEQCEDFELYSVVDERSAAFFAIGLIQRTGRPAAVCCSSGTACMNYGSAIVEAYYQRLPLLVISSDRLPQFLNQMEDQMYDQASTFTSCTKYVGRLTPISSDLDFWYNNRIINEGLIELTHHSNGPVHLNIPFLSHHTDTFTNTHIPVARKVELYSAESSSETWAKIANLLKGKKICIVWGQSVCITAGLKEAVDKFVENFDAIILTDLLSNCHCKYTIANTGATLYSLTNEEKRDFKPDIVFSIGANILFNGEIKGFLGDIENWQIGKYDKISDPFRSLTKIFEMSELMFFNMINNIADFKVSGNFAHSWMSVSNIAYKTISEYSEAMVIGALIKALPADSDLQLANSYSVRMAHLFPVPDSVTVNCNRGVNGIDGSMSTAIGFSAINSRKTFYITGDLSFYYDLNSLSIRHITPNLRILLINNGGGGVMYSPLSEELRKSVAEHVCAFHTHKAHEIAKAFGFKYFAIRNESEISHGIELLTAESDHPVLVEAFSNIPVDTKVLSNYYKSMNRQHYTISQRIIMKGKRILGGLLPQKN